MYQNRNKHIYKHILAAYLFWHGMGDHTEVYYQTHHYPIKSCLISLPKTTRPFWVTKSTQLCKVCSLILSCFWIKYLFTQHTLSRTGFLKTKMTFCTSAMAFSITWPQYYWALVGSIGKKCSRTLSTILLIQEFTCFTRSMVQNFSLWYKTILILYK